MSDYGIPVDGGGTRDSSCSGGLISPHWVLTAGHCFKDSSGTHVSRTVAAKSTATVGRTNLTSSDGQVANVVAVRQHPASDVALARLDRAITSVRPMKLPRSRPYVGDVVRLTGFGLTKTRGNDLPQRLRTGQFHLLGHRHRGRHGRIATGFAHESVGGPYFTECTDGTATVVGVVSHGPDCPHTGPDQAARIDIVASWIRSVIGSDTAPPPTKPAPSAAAAPDAPGSSPPYWILMPAGMLVAGLGLAALRARADRRRGPRRRPLG